MLALVLLCFPQLLFAQKVDTFSTMKPGDWFDVLVADTARKADKESYRYHLKYLLKKVDAEGNKEYALTFQRIRIILSAPNHALVGYDSYYPPYKQGIQQRSLKPVFISKVDKTGKILTLKPKFDFPEVDLQQIASSKEEGVTWVKLTPVHEQTATVLSEIILGAIARRERDWYDGKLYKKSGLSFALFAATFPLAPNVLIEGKIKNMNEQVKESLNLYLPGNSEELHIGRDGNFRMTAFIAEGSEARLSYSYLPESAATRGHANRSKDVDVVIDTRKLDVPLFLQPGDTIRIAADANNLVNSLQFSGNARTMATFGLELAKLAQAKKTPEIPYYVKSFSAESYMRAQDADESTFKRQKARYSGQLSTAALKYYHLKFAFEQANGRLDFLSKTNYKNSPEATEIFEDFPRRFFNGIDTLPVLMTDFNTADWYTSFLNSFHFYMTAKISRFNGGSNGFFLGDYIFSLNYLRRFPLYRTLADAFENELGNNSWNGAQTLKPYYDDFINNCGDTALTNTVQQKWETLSKWAPGSQMPLKNIRLADGSLLDLKKYTGKALSITFNYHYPDEMKRLLGRIKEQDPEKVHFLVVQLIEKGYPASTISKELKKLPQVSYVEVTRDNEELEETALLKYWDVKTFVLDAEQKIIQDNINDGSNELPQDKVFEEALKKALAPKTMSKEDKAELIKTTGWSLGSILFASLIFFWIYKARVSAITKKESLKRQIKELEIKAIRSQMNPHFMFNALNSIQSLINNRQYKEANIYLEKFSLLMRRVLDNSEKSFVSLSDEIAALTLYAELEKLRFDFAFSIKVDGGINPDLIEIPGMIIQPLVENAILHGIAQKGSEGNLAIHISKAGDCLKIDVIDNGLGLSAGAGEKHNGFGLKLVRERLNLLNTQGVTGKLKINDNLDQDAGGVTASLTIPID